MSLLKKKKKKELSFLALQSSWWHKNPFKLNKMTSKNFLYRWELSTWFITLCHSIHPSTHFIYPLVQHSELLEGVGVHHCAMEGLPSGCDAGPVFPAMALDVLLLTRTLPCGPDPRRESGGQLHKRGVEPVCRSAAGGWWCWMSSWRLRTALWNKSP